MSTKFEKWHTIAKAGVHEDPLGKVKLPESFGSLIMYDMQSNRPRNALPLRFRNTEYPKATRNWPVLAPPQKDVISGEAWQLLTRLPPAHVTTPAGQLTARTPVRSIEEASVIEDQRKLYEATRKSRGPARGRPHPRSRSSPAVPQLSEEVEAYLPFNPSHHGPSGLHPAHQLAYGAYAAPEITAPHPYLLDPTGYPEYPIPYGAHAQYPIPYEHYPQPPLTARRPHPAPFVY